MNEDLSDYPSCFGILERVFPLGQDGLRTTPDECMSCPQKTLCLRTAMKSKSGLDAQSEYVDRAYKSGLMSFISRWSKKKQIHNKLNA